MPKPKNPMSSAGKLAHATDKVKFYEKQMKKIQAILNQKYKWRK
jgi:hypothetical protein